MKKEDDRLQALRIISTLLQDKVSLAQLMPPGAECSPLTKELCFGVCRHFFRLEVLASHFVKKKPKDIEVWVALLMGLYQLHYMNKPDYAVVKETVQVLEKVKKTWAKALVNAVLRQFCRQKEELIPQLEKQAVFKYGHPDWFLKQLKKDWPQHWEAIIKANDEHPPMTLRINQTKISVADYMKELKANEIEAECHAVATQAVTLKIPSDVKKLPGFALGWISVQDSAAQLAASLLSLKPGLRILDACCAPGGKTGHILETQPDIAECVALDVDERRLARVKENLERLQLQATIVTGDAADPTTWWDGKLFDRILLDAPCSATGVIRRHPDIKLLRTPEEVSQVVLLQESILEAMWPLLKPGGLMVYATCSVLPVENEQQMARFKERHADCQVYKEHWAWGEKTSHGQQILPGQQGMDGFFYSVLQKG